MSYKMADKLLCSLTVIMTSWWIVWHTRCL